MRSSRRGFLRTLLGSLTILALRPLSLIRAATRKVAIPLEKIPALREVGGWTVLKLKDRKILLARPDEATVLAACAECTHKKVQVRYDHQEGRLVCPKHGSRFDLQGKVLKGPAKKDLCGYEASLDGERVILDLGEES